MVCVALRSWHSTPCDTVTVLVAPSSPLPDTIDRLKKQVPRSVDARGGIAWNRPVLSKETDPFDCKGDCACRPQSMHLVWFGAGSRPLERNFQRAPLSAGSARLLRRQMQEPTPSSKQSSSASMASKLSDRRSWGPWTQLSEERRDRVVFNNLSYHRFLLQVESNARAAR